MKKQTLIIFSAVLVLTAFGIGLINLNSPKESLLVKTNYITPEADQNIVTKEFKIFGDFIYDIGPRFGSITKSEIGKITSIEAFLDDDVIENMANIKSTSIILVIDEQQSNIRAYGNSKHFSEAQLDLLRNSSYSTNFAMRVEFEEKYPGSQNVFDSYRSPHYTIVPEVQASYSDGKDALKLFLKESCLPVLTHVDPQKLKPAKLYFTVSENGTLKNIRLDRDSGYPEVDKKMIEVMNHLPGIWSPATDEKGNNVSQELVVSFGLMGC